MRRRAVNFITMYNQHLCNTLDSLHSLYFLLCSKNSCGVSGQASYSLFVNEEILKLDDLDQLNAEAPQICSIKIQLTES